MRLTLSSKLVSSGFAFTFVKMSIYDPSPRFEMMDTSGLTFIQPFVRIPYPLWEIHFLFLESQLREFRRHATVVLLTCSTFLGVEPCFLCFVDSFNCSLSSLCVAWLTFQLDAFTPLSFTVLPLPYQLDAYFHNLYILVNVPALLD